jgi:hypothetical protein
MRGPVNEATRTSPTARLVGWAAAVCWLASWFLPVVDDYPGWAAFRAAVTGPFRESSPVGGEDAIAQFLSALTNLAFIALWVSWRRARIKRPALFLKLTIACLLFDLYWIVEMLRAGEYRGLLVGYYVWLAAFALLVALGVLNVVSIRRTSRTPTAGTPA